ncbi:ABC transporter substrate-binding protein [Streptomyces sp. NBC_00145]|uniref:ABC transporter substrate-binding protein n=1 Tax=Streptomyces sp. NBC_00145 TaxID=2975666 RepID=UPI002E1980E5
MLAGCGSGDAGGNGSAGQSPSSATNDVSAPLTPVDAKLLAAAEKEGSLLIYGEANDNAMKPVVDAFEDQYPKIKAKYLSLHETENFQRYLTESATGGRTADVILSTNKTGFLDLVKRREIADYSPPSAAGLPDYATLAPGVYAMEENPVVAVFNKALLPESKQPSTLAGLADMADTLKGKIVTYDAGNGGFGYEANEAYLSHAGEDGWSTLTQLGKSTRVEDGAATMFTKLAQGEYAASYFLSGVTRQYITGGTAQVLNYKYLTDGTPFIPRGVGITTGAKSPSAAKVFANFLLSARGQSAACKGGFTPYRDGVNCPVSVAKLKAQLGAENINMVTWDSTAGSSRADITRRWKAAFGR